MQHRSSIAAVAIYFVALAIAVLSILNANDRTFVFVALLVGSATLVPLLFPGPITMRPALFYLAAVIFAVFASAVLANSIASNAAFKAVFVTVAIVDVVLVGFAIRTLLKSRRDYLREATYD